MVKIRLSYVVEDVDRHGNVRLYFRRPGQPKIRLRGIPGSKEFNDQYEQALAGKLTSGKAGPARRLAVKGEMAWLCKEYYQSSNFKHDLEPCTQQTRRLILDKFCQQHGDKPYARLEPQKIREFRDERCARPDSANGLLKALRGLFKWATSPDVNLCDRNPAKEVPFLKNKSSGYHSWTFKEVRQFEDYYPVGTRARLAAALLFFTGQRRSDIVRFGPAHVRNGWLTFTQVKNRNRNPVTLELPVLPELQAIINASPIGASTFLVTEFGKPFSVAGFGNRFRDWCDAAGLKHCSAHGLRKAGAAIAAENGATDNQLKAMFGWTTNKEVTRYTKAARQKKLAGAAMSLLIANQNDEDDVPL